MPPVVVLGPPDLGIDEAVDALIADDLPGMDERQPGAGLLRRPAFLQTAKDFLGQKCIPLEARAFPAARLGSLLSVSGSVTDLLAGVARQFASNCRWRAIQI